jgi:glycosyltransferase involved in cell wall biosynthesis
MPDAQPSDPTLTTVGLVQSSSPRSKPAVDGRRFSEHANRSGEPGRPLITVATVVYNAAEFLRSAIDSVLSQNYDNVEYIVIDGGSTDGTMDIIREYESRIDYCISEPDGGIYDAMNKARKAARGDWLIFLGADDQLIVQLSSIAAGLTDRGAIYYGDVEIAASGATSGGRFNRYRLMQENICHQAIFYPRSVYRVKSYDTNAGILADHKYNMELWGIGTRFIHLPHVVSRFNDQGASSGYQAYFESIKLATIRSSFGWLFYVIKLARNAAVRLVKGHRESA